MHRPSLVLAMLLGLIPCAHADDPSGEICPRRLVLGGAVFGQAGDLPTADTGIGCALRPVIDPAQPAWVAYDAFNVPQRLVVRMRIDLSATVLGADDEVEILEVRSATPHAPAVAVWLVGQEHPELRLSWTDGSTRVVSKPLPLGSATPSLALWLERGDPEVPDSGVARLLVDSREALAARGSQWSDAVLPEPGSTEPARISFGVVSVARAGRNPLPISGALAFKPLAVELGWGSATE